MKEKTNPGQAVVRAKPARRGRIGAVSVRRLAAVLLCFAVSFLLAGTEAFPGTYPFGLAAVSAVTGMSAMLPVLAGGLLGAVRIPAAGGIHALLFTLLAVGRMVLSVWLGTERMQFRPFAGGDALLREPVRLRMALSSCAALFAGAWSVIRGGYGYYDLFGTVVSLLFTPLLVWLMYAASDRNLRTSPFREAGIYAMLALLTHALQTLFPAGRAGIAEGIGIASAPFGAGILFAFAVSAVIGERYGIHRGTAAGVCCGMVLDLRYLPCFVLAGGLTSLLGRYSQTLAVLSAGVCASAWAVVQAGADGLTAVLPPVTAACAVLIPLYRSGRIRLPEENRVFGGASRSMAAEAGLVLRSRDETGRRLSAMAESLTSVSAILTGMSEKLSRPGKAEMREICEAAFGTYCRGCALRSKCHEARHPKTGPVIEAMAGALVRDGAVTAGTVPNSLAAHCFSIGRILDEINRTAGERAVLRKGSGRLAVTAADFGFAGELFRTVHDDGEAVLQPDGELTKKLRRLLRLPEFEAGSVTVYGGRRKRILVRDIGLAATRMGEEDIRKMFEKEAGMRLSAPEFTLDGAVLSMTMQAVPAYACLSGQAACAARGSCTVHASGDMRDEAAYCRERYEGITEEAAGDAGNGAVMAARGTPDGKNGYEEYAEYEEYEEYEMESGAESYPRAEVTDEPPRGKEVCGDAIASFEADGKYYMLISDGMGSGREAALTSGVSAAVLQRLIGAGAGLETALKMLNGILRAGERECSATVDIAEIDLLTGDARFIKSGAAPSFVLRGGSIFRLQSKTVPVGIIRALDAEMIRFSVLPGDRVIMVSDGAARSYEEVPWLLDMMSSDDVLLKGSPKDAAAKIVREAAGHGSSDDITAGVICIVPA